LKNPRNEGVNRRHQAKQYVYDQIQLLLESITTAEPISDANTGSIGLFTDQASFSYQKTLNTEHGKMKITMSNITQTFFQGEDYQYPEYFLDWINRATNQLSNVNFGINVNIDIYTETETYTHNLWLQEYDHRYARAVGIGWDTTLEDDDEYVPTQDKKRKA